jgi:hypothetical protein
LIRIAITSDLHCQLPNAATRFEDSYLLVAEPALPENQNPLASLKKLIVTDGLVADILLSPGDLTNKACPYGLNYAHIVLRDIQDALRAPSLAITLGNHDINSRGISNELPYDRAWRISTTFPAQNQADADRYWNRGYYILTLGACRIICLNTAATHLNADRAKRGEVTERTLASLDDDLEREPTDKPQILLCHHHPHPHRDIEMSVDDLMVNGERLLEILKRHNIGLVIHGHKHRPRISYAAGGSAAPTVIACGSFSAVLRPPLSNRTRNLFHILELPEDTLEGCSLRGTIRTWEYAHGIGWSPSSERSADLPHLAGFGCRLTIEDLESRISSYFADLPTDWDSLCFQVPQLQFITPDIQTDLCTRLRARGYQVSLDDSGRPHELVRPQQGSPT